MSFPPYIMLLYSHGPLNDWSCLAILQQMLDVIPCYAYIECEYESTLEVVYCWGQGNKVGISYALSMFCRPKSLLAIRRLLDGLQTLNPTRLPMSCLYGGYKQIIYVYTMLWVVFEGIYVESWRVLGKGGVIHCYGSHFWGCLSYLDQLDFIFQRCVLYMVYMNIVDI